MPITVFSLSVKFQGSLEPGEEVMLTKESVMTSYRKIPRLVSKVSPDCRIREIAAPSEGLLSNFCPSPILQVNQTGRDNVF